MAPLVYLFKAVAARSDRVRTQLLGLVIAAPLFLAAAAVLTAETTRDAAAEFVAGDASADISAAEAREECVSERDDDDAAFRDDFGAGPSALRRCAEEEIADDAAANAVSDAPARSLAMGLGLGGRIGLAFALFYGCLWAMRTGLLSRFWGSLGMAMGVAALLLLIQFTFVWFLYFGLLVAGWVPGGRPPAWAAGEAVPWPSPGERAAEELEAAEEPPGPGEGEGPPEEPGERRKRKQRD
jgi:hypothetical protein